MKLNTLALLAVLSLISCKPAAQSPSLNEHSLFQAMEENTQWPSYRGYFANGYVKGARLPQAFDVASGTHVKWQLPVPGLGLSCPVIWDEHVFITTAISEEDQEGYRTGLYGDIEPVADSSEHRWVLYCINKADGSIRWEEVMHTGIPAVKRHPKSSHATTTVATDGKHVVAFLGSEGLYCYSVKGDLLWKRDFGLIKSEWHLVEGAEWEFSSSPLIHEGRVILQADARNQAFVAVLDLASGETLWRQDREDIPNWCTPNIYYDGEQPRMVVNGYQRRAAYDLESGEEIWHMAGGGDIPVPTPIVWKDLIYFNSAHGRHAPLMAVRNSVTGEVSYPEKDTANTSEMAWFYDREGAYMTSVVVYDSLLYRMRWNGNLSCFDARTGEKHYGQTVKAGSFIAAPVIADDKIYLVAENGMVYVVKTGTSYELLGSSDLGEVSLVTPGLVQDLIIFRTAGKLIAVGP